MRRSGYVHGIASRVWLRARSIYGKNLVLRDPTLPSDVRSIVGRASTTIHRRDDMFHRGGQAYFSAASSAIRCIEAAQTAAAVASPREVLDLPCGYGRVLRLLVHKYPTAKFTACDLDEEASRFCASHFGATAAHSSTELDEVDVRTRFDLIWCGSLLTHLPKDRGSALIRLLRRHLRPGGLAVFSAHGDTTAGRLASGRLAHGLPMDSLGRLLEEYRQTGFGFIENYGIPGYGTSLTSRDWVRGQISAGGGLLLTSFDAGAWASNQDVFGVVRAP